ncbi:E3 ubiquitin-protein ligase Bre1-like [Tigriopus californicus]|uniref:E3 ubiquitin-protein ligase Bre1-like n=1 Tax=Tigriopus californicus TaxID=6832 RepID=UPI0027DA8D95|nr:E3 ubiquitin-protein ligase Bre1-like [Tigriopus californicus]
MNKRGAEDPPGGGGASGIDGAGVGLEPPSKKRIVFEPLQLGPISNLEELELKTLAFQNQKLGLRLTQRIQIEDELRARIDQLEKRQMQDDAVMNVINRYWNQLNEDIRILLQRFDGETGDESEKKNEHESTTSFLTQLATWHKEELDEKLASKVQVSQRAVAKIIQVFDHLNQRNEKLARAIRGEKEPVTIDPAEEEKPTEVNGDEAKTAAANEEGTEKVSLAAEETVAAQVPAIVAIDDQVKELNIRLQSENSNLHRLNTSLHEKNHYLALKHAELEEGINAEETKNEELQNKVDDLEYELTKTRMRNGKFETCLSETQEKLKMFVDRDGGRLDQKVVLSNAERKTVDQLTHDMEEQRELATNRLSELEDMNTKYKDSLKQVETLKMELSTLPEHVVVETTEHKCLQSQFSVLYNEAMQLKTQLEETRSQLQVAKNTHMRQIEQMESEELLAQKKLRTEVIQLEDMLAQVRKEYEMLRIEFEQNLAANEQTGPINKEMRNLITSLQTHNVQLKGEVARYKRKGKEGQLEIAKLRKDLDDSKAAEIRVLQQIKKLQEQQQSLNSSHDPDSGDTKVKEEGDNLAHPMVRSGSTSSAAGDEDSQLSNMDGVDKMEVGDEDDVKVKIESDENSQLVSDATGATEGGSPDSLARSTPVKKEVKAETAAAIAMANVKECKEKIEELQKARAKDQEGMKDLKSQLKKAQNELKEMKLLLDMYKSCSKEQRDKAAIMVSEKKARGEVEELKLQLKKLSEAKKEEKKRLADEDATRRIKQLEEQCGQLQKQVGNHKQEEEALLSEMEVTGQAFEDMQEQNLRLIQQLREKDDANFKLMSERIKSNQIQRLAREERDMLTQQVSTLSTQVEAQNQVVRKLEEKERLLQNNLQTVEKELSMRQQAMEMHKRKAIESAQSAADLKLHLEKYHAQIKEVQQTVSEKTSALEGEAFKTKRYHEDLVLCKRKVERLRKIEMASDMDEILKEEIREYKETLTCPSCKVKRKDAVLTKCFHCFCYDCLRTRYETRQRKCPKCNAGFGASDYHRLYLS